MNKREFYKRVSGLLNLEQLQGKKVVIVGLGSGGCRVAAELGRLGVHLFLVERPGERLAEHNIVRHLLGYRSLGRLKLTEMVRYIRNLNPRARLTPCTLDVVEQNWLLAKRLEKWRPDLIAVCTDNEQSKHAINQVALRLGVPQIGAGVYDGGIGGEVYRVFPGMACYGCIASQLKLQRFTPGEKSRPDYTQPVPEQPPATCALNLDIEQIAVLHSRFILEALLEGKATVLGLDRKINLCVFANRVVPGTFERPLKAEFFHLARQKDCLDCGEFGGDVEAEADRIVASMQGTTQGPTQEACDSCSPSSLPSTSS